MLIYACHMLYATVTDSKRIRRKERLCLYDGLSTLAKEEQLSAFISVDDFICIHLPIHLSKNVSEEVSRTNENNRSNKNEMNTK